MTEKKFTTDYLLQVSRLIGEIQHLSTVVHLATEMASDFDYLPYVKKVDFYFAPTKEMYEKRFESLQDEKVIKEELWMGIEHENYVIKKLMGIKRFLKSALKENGVDYGKLDYTIETVEYKRYIV